MYKILEELLQQVPWNQYKTLIMDKIQAIIFVIILINTDSL